MINYIDIIKQFTSILSSILFTILYYPQIKKLIKTNDTRSFSINYLRILLLGYIFYIVFLTIEKLYILLISSIINTLCIFYMYYKKIKNIKRKKQIKEEINKQLKEVHNIMIIQD